MASSTEFAQLVNKLHQSPNDSSLKKAVVELLPRMIYLAKNDPMALYHLAHIYAPNSPQYQQTMCQAANLGCTSAMLAMCQILARSKNPRAVIEASLYLAKINGSDDLYVKEEAKKLITKYPQLAEAQEHEQCNSSHAHRFFISQQRIDDGAEIELLSNLVYA